MVGKNSDRATLEKSLAVSYQVKHIFTYNPELPLLGVYPKERLTFTQKPICECLWWLYSLACVQCPPETRLGLSW